jgi:hypothetical protein
MADSNVEKLAAQLQAKLENDTPEEIVMGLTNLILLRKDFKSDELYRAIFKTAAAALYIKTQTGKW